MRHLPLTWKRSCSSNVMDDSGGHTNPPLSFYTAKQDEQHRSDTAVLGRKDNFMITNGTIQSIIYRNPETGFCVLSFLDEQNKERTATGTLPLCDVGDQVEFEGELVRHERYGSQLAVSAYRRVAPRTLTAITAYLGSGAVRGIGPSLAAAIVGHFGMETLEVMEKTPERLTEISGIGHKKCAVIASSFAEARVMREILLSLEPYGVTISQSYKLYQSYGELCLAKIQENPYRMIDDIDGIGFQTADNIAQNMAGFEHDSLSRVKAGIVYALQSAASDHGHTFLPRDKLLQKSGGLLGVPNEILQETIDWMLGGGELIYQMVDEVDGVFLPWLANAERGIASRLLSLSIPPIGNPPWDIAALEEELNLSLSEQQRTAVLSALHEGVQVITGGPGTGKTTIIRFIVHAMLQAGFSVALAAPTGRAAKRMTEATGMDASTLHRLLEYQPGAGFQRNRDFPLEEDMLIVDEMSMVDVPLMHALLKASQKGMRLVLVGDSDQLPPVGCGDALRNIIDSGTLPVIALTEIFRQAQRSRIVTNAHLINQGRMPNLHEQDTDFIFEPLHNPDDILARVLQLVQNEHALLGTHEPLMDVQVLTPVKKSTLGVLNLNTQLQAALNPKSGGKPEFLHGNIIFREGDKVMQIKNNYKQAWEKPMPGGGMTEGAGVFNGDLGTLYRLDTASRSMQILFDDERLSTYDFRQADELDLAYCMSIHKSQGSEFKTILLPLAGGPPMLLTRNLLYTAVTRAKQLVYCIGRTETIAQMVRTSVHKRRFTSLATRLALADDED